MKTIQDLIKEKTDLENRLNQLVENFISSNKNVEINISANFIEDKVKWQKIHRFVGFEVSIKL